MIIPLVYIDTLQLKDKSEADQKQFLGNHIYPFVEQMYPSDAGKITGMLLQKTVNEILGYCANRDLFTQTVH
jgi:Poly-adenylate binding protein, unique domain